MTRPALIFFLLLVASAPFSAAQDSALGSCPCTLKGVVLNSVTGSPVRNALVESSAGSPNAVLTDSDGVFHFDNLPFGAVTLSVVKPGFLPSSPFLSQPPSFRVAPDAPPAVVKIVPGGVVRGHISDDRGVPLENFSLQLIRRLPGSLRSAEQAVTQSFVTNDLGNFRIPDLPAGSYYLMVFPRDNGGYRHSGDGAPTGYPRVYYPGVLDVSTATPIKVSAGRESVANLTLTAKPYIRLSGKITGYAAGSAVHIAFEPLVDSQSSQSTKFDPLTGAFETEWLPPGEYTISASAEEPNSGDAAPGPPSARISVTAAASVSGINLALTRPVLIPIRIDGLDRKADLEQVSILANPQDGASPESASTVPKETPFDLPSGTDMFFDSLRQASYRLEISTASDEPYYVESARFGSVDLLTSDLVIDSSSAAHAVEIVFRKGAATLSGNVDLKDAARGAIVCLFPQNSASPVFRLAAASGAFLFEDLRPGAYRIAAVDALSDVDFSNPDSLKRISSAATEISLVPAQSLALELSLITVGD